MYSALKGNAVPSEPLRLSCKLAKLPSNPAMPKVSTVPSHRGRCTTWKVSRERPFNPSCAPSCTLDIPSLSRSAAESFGHASEQLEQRDTDVDRPPALTDSWLSSASSSARE